MSRVTFIQRSVEKVYELYDGRVLVATVTWRGKCNPSTVVYPEWADAESAQLVFDLIDKLDSQEALEGTSGVTGAEDDEEDDED